MAEQYDVLCDLTEPVIPINLANGKRCSGDDMSGSSATFTVWTYTAKTGYAIKDISVSGASAAYVSGTTIEVYLSRDSTIGGTLSVTITLTNGQVYTDSIEIFYSTYCLTGDSLITLADYTQKRIDEIKIGEKVLCFNPSTNELTTDIISYADSNLNKSFTEYDIWTFSDNTIVKTVHRHRLYNYERQKMVNMDEWKIGEHAFNIKGELIELIDHKNIKEEANHYTIFTKKYNNYFVNNLLSGNKYTPELKLK